MQNKCVDDRHEDHLQALQDFPTWSYDHGKSKLPRSHVHVKILTIETLEQDVKYVQC